MTEHVGAGVGRRLTSVGRVTSTLMFPYKEDLIRFDFEVAPDDEYMCETTMVKMAEQL